MQQTGGERRWYAPPRPGRDRLARSLRSILVAARGVSVSAGTRAARGATFIPVRTALVRRDLIGLHLDDWRGRHSSRRNRSHRRGRSAQRYKIHCGGGRRRCWLGRRGRCNRDRHSSHRRSSSRRWHLRRDAAHGQGSAASAHMLETAQHGRSEKHGPCSRSSRLTSGSSAQLLGTSVALLNLRGECREQADTGIMDCEVTRLALRLLSKKQLLLRLAPVSLGELLVRLPSREKASEPVRTTVRSVAFAPASPAADELAARIRRPRCQPLAQRRQCSPEPASRT